ncbi:MAG: phosphotriesterase-related protein, partial [Pseudomonadota bacterium]
MRPVQSVLGPIDIGAIGRTLIHEHIFIALPGAEFDPTASVDRPAIIEDAIRRLRQLREEFGVETFVDPCPIEMGRDPE